MGRGKLDSRPQPMQGSGADSLAPSILMWCNCMSRGRCVPCCDTIRWKRRRGASASPIVCSDFAALRSQNTQEKKSEKKRLKGGEFPHGKFSGRTRFPHSSLLSQFSLDFDTSSTGTQLNSHICFTETQNGLT